VPTATPEPPRRRRLPAGVLVRFAVLVILVGAGWAALRWSPLAAHLGEEELVATLRSLAASPWAPVALIGLYVVLCPLGMPVSPLLLAGGLVFGFGPGTVYNLVGTWLGAAVTFGVARLLGQDFMEHLLGERLERVERLVERHGFWTLVRLRFVPIPYALVNYAAALARVPASVFLSATAVGLVPAVAVLTYFAAALFRAAAGDRAGVVLQLAAALAGMLLLSFLPRLLRRRGGEQP